MFHESLKKQFSWNLMLRCTVKLTLNQHFMKHPERKFSQCILPLLTGYIFAAVVVVAIFVLFSSLIPFSKFMLITISSVCIFFGTLLIVTIHSNSLSKMLHQICQLKFSLFINIAYNFPVVNFTFTLRSSSFPCFVHQSFLLPL